MDNLTIILIMIAVMIVIPVIFARLSGRNPMELFFGRRVNDTGFGAGEKKQDPQALIKRGPCDAERVGFDTVRSMVA